MVPLFLLLASLQIDLVLVRLPVVVPLLVDPQFVAMVLKMEVKVEAVVHLTSNYAGQTNTLPIHVQIYTRMLAKVPLQMQNFLRHFKLSFMLQMITLIGLMICM